MSAAGEPVYTDGATADGPADGGPVEAWLDSAFDRLTGTGAAGRRLLAESEDHLRTAVDHGLACGLSVEQAESEAVARMGSAAKLAREFARLRWEQRLAELTRRLRVGAVGAMRLVALVLVGAGAAALTVSAGIEVLILSDPAGEIEAHVTAAHRAFGVGGILLTAGVVSLVVRSRIVRRWSDRRGTRPAHMSEAAAAAAGGVFLALTHLLSRGRSDFGVRQDLWGVPVTVAASAFTSLALLACLAFIARGLLWQTSTARRRLSSR
jgi:hypothetical protein